MYIFNTCHPKAHLFQGYPPVMPTAECRLCGERVRLTPIEALTNQAELNSGSYVCPLCRRLMAEAESGIPHDLDLSSLFPPDEAVPFSTLMMNEMEDQYDDSYEEESDSDEAADDECEGKGGMYPPSDEGPDAEERGDGELPLEADFWLQVHVHLTIRRNRQTR